MKPTLTKQIEKMAEEYCRQGSPGTFHVAWCVPAFIAGSKSTHSLLRKEIREEVLKMLRATDTELKDFGGIKVKSFYGGIEVANWLESKFKEMDEREK